MRNLLIVVFICIVGYGLLSQPHKEKVDEAIESVLEQVPDIIEAIEDKLEDIAIQHEFGKGTTREDLRGGGEGRFRPQSKDINEGQTLEEYLRKAKEYDDWYMDNYHVHIQLRDGTTLKQRQDSGYAPGK